MEFERFLIQKGAKFGGQMLASFFMFDAKKIIRKEKRPSEKNFDFHAFPAATRDFSPIFHAADDTADVRHR